MIKERIIKLIEKIQHGATLNSDEKSMAKTPLYILHGYKIPKDHVQDIRNKNRMNFL